MRRLTQLLCTLLTALLLTVGAQAATEITTMNMSATVHSDGDAQVEVHATVHVDAGLETLHFPLPQNVSHVSLNGSWTRTYASDTGRYVDLSGTLGNFTGDMSFSINYSLSNLVSYNEAELLDLRVPMLSGFAYPIKGLEFTITLPGSVDKKPAFSSGYHQTNIEQDLQYAAEHAQIHGRFKKALKDHETLEMILPVTEDMFPQTALMAPDVEQVSVAAVVCAAAAFLYWLIFLRCLPPWGKSLPAPPEGYGAGELHSILHLQSPDLTLMVFTWAQLGYVILQQDRKGRVKIHKQMDMGNERSSFERRCFSNLFGSRSVADTTSLRYCELAKRMAKTAPNLQSLVHKRSGNLRVFRFLAALPGLCCGVSMGVLMMSGAVLQWPTVIFTALAGFFAAYLMELWCQSLLSPSRGRFFLTLVLAGGWILAGSMLEHPELGFSGAACGIFSGMFLFCSGKRTPPGRQAMNEIAGLCRYLLTVSGDDLQIICRQNPEYFYDMLPYAMALGADRVFARRFGDFRLPACPYVYLGSTGSMDGSTALQWSRRMRSMARSMDARRRRALQDRVFRLAKSFYR